MDLHRAASPGGQNFGWKVMEGLSCFSNGACPAATPVCNAPQLTLPIHAYPHGTGDCSITGGYMYRGTRAPEVLGRYIFGDYCTGAMRTLREATPGVWQSRALPPAGGTVTSFGEDVDGELYVAVGNDMRKLVAVTPPVPATSLGVGRWHSDSRLIALGSLRLALRRSRSVHL